MFKYLKEQSYYEDVYDLGTIERCLNIIEFWKGKENDKELDNVEKSERYRLINMGMNLQLYCTKGEAYRGRSEAIQRWQDDDRLKDKFYEDTKEPEGVSCVKCLVLMKVVSKDHWYEYQKPLRIIFLFECPKCQNRKGVYDNGQEYVSKPDSCPKCAKEINVSFKYKGNISIWEKRCSFCGYKEKQVEDDQLKKDEQKAKELKDKQLIEKYRVEFCLSDNEGMEYIIQSKRLEVFTESLKEEEQKKADPDYHKVVNIKKLGIVELEKTLSNELGKQNYIKLMLEKPEIDRFVIVPFTIQDSDGLRKDRDSEYKLRRLIKKILVGTNWRLMSEGVSYRLGYLSGKLKGYEREEDLLKMMKSD